MLGGGRYYGLVAGLREYSPEASGGKGATQKDFDADEIYGDIRRELSRRDRRAAGLLWSLTDIYGLPRERIDWLYGKCARSGSGFLRAWAEFDREFRQSIVDGALPELDIADIVKKERALDEVRWNKAAELAEFDDFGIDTILAYLARIAIIRRWAVLDPAIGREIYDRLVNEMTSQVKIEQ